MQQFFLSKIEMTYQERQQLLENSGSVPIIDKIIVLVEVQHLFNMISFLVLCHMLLFLIQKFVNACMFGIFYRIFSGTPLQRF